MNPETLTVDAELVELPRLDGASVYPRLERLPDDRLAIGVACDVAWDYFVGGSWTVLVSVDDGATWSRSEDLTIPLNWAGFSTRERHDRATMVLPDGSFWAAGVVGWQTRPEAERPTVTAAGLHIVPTPPPGQPGMIGVGSNTVFVQRSTDGGHSWTRREVELPSAGWSLGLPRNIILDDGAVLLPVRQRSQDAEYGQFLVVRVTPGDPDTIRPYPVPRDLTGRTGSEAALASLGGGDVVMLMRADRIRGGDGTMLASWSEDGGRTWTLPVSTGLRGHPPHLLRLSDGRLLVTYGHQAAPRGVLAAVSPDEGETWTAAPPALIAADPEATAGIGYHPMTAQLSDDSLLTTYYAFEQGVGHAHAVHWKAPW